MTGSEKQIEYANDILAKVNKSLDWALENAPNENVKSYVENLKSTINNAYAGKVINCFKDYALSGNPEKNIKEVFATYNAYQKISINQDKF